MLTRQKLDLSIERRVLSNIIMDSSLLGFAKHIGKSTLFEANPCKIVAGWIWHYFDQIGEAPGPALSDVFRQQVGLLTSADADLVQDLLTSLSSDWDAAKPSNVHVAKQMIEKYFRQRALTVLQERLSEATLSDDPSLGERLVADYIKPENHVASDISMFLNPQTIASAFDSQEDVLFRFPAELGRLIGPVTTEDFIAYMSPPKRGKSWWLMYSAMVAALQGKKVLLISLEMSEAQVIRRMWQMLTGTSRYGETSPWGEFYSVGANKFETSVRSIVTPRVNTDIDVITRGQADLRRACRGGELKIRVYPTNSFGLADFRGLLNGLHVYEKYDPEVVSLDYADIMSKGKHKDAREAINDNWLGLRGIASEYKLGLFTASQTGRRTVTGDRDANEDDASDDIRKIAHCSKVIMINQNKNEKRDNLFRLKCNTTRDQAAEMDDLLCTGCLAIGRPYLDGRFMRDINIPAT